VSVVLRKGTSDLAVLAVGASPPTVTLTAPNGGETYEDAAPVEWTAYDGDGDDLTCNLFYSPDDGASWMPTVMGITGTSAYTLDLRLLPGSDAGRLRIEVSDGFHTARDDSDGAFTVAGKVPWVGILSPMDGDVVAPRPSLWGYGYDVEDGELSGESLAWASDRDGLVGNGEMVWDVDLSPGRHTLTLTATDSAALVASETITVWVSAGLTYLPLVLR
jgi:hypothetical protein